MRCKNCGDVQPDPELVIKVVEKKVEVGDGAVATRLGLCLTVVLLFLIGSCAFTEHQKYAALEKAFLDPSVKIQHEDTSNGATLKVSR